MTTPARQRAAAARLLRQVVVEGRTTDRAMAGKTITPLTRELVLGCLRHFFSLERAVHRALRQPLRAKDRDLGLLMIVGVYQLWHLRIPDHAAIFETVQACRVLGKPWASGLVNAVLRRCRERQPTPSERSFEHPEWLESALRREYPDAAALMLANNDRAPMTLRINLARTSPPAYLARLEAAGLASRPYAWAAADPHGWPGPETRVLLEPVPTDALPGFGDGAVSVQDAGAQLAAPLLGPGPGDRVLDACAAPGGKLFHLRERCPALAVTALEVQPERLAQLRAEAARLGHEAVHLIQADATGLDWWDGIPFSHILLDAPCSGTGTLRRHPDIKLLRRPEDVTAMAALQRRLLANLWRVLAPGGTLLYCTCSILSAENDAVIEDFLAAHRDAVTEGFDLATGRPMRLGWQLLPTDADTDGFYYARLNKARA